jgi:hypothetical protein
VAKKLRDKMLVVHLNKGASHLGPNGVDVIVKSLQGEHLELWLLLAEEGEDARRRN